MNKVQSNSVFRAGRPFRTLNPRLWQLLAPLRVVRLFQIPTCLEAGSVRLRLDECGQQAASEIPVLFHAAAEVHSAGRMN